MCFLPWRLKNRWHDRIRALVEAWTGGVALEKTDLYGLRSYPDGAVLLPHVDRETTHAASVIVNVAQYGLRAPWMLRVKDLESSELVNVPLRPGEMLFYESAAVIHGRPEPLRGDGYVSYFAHYRPVGDESWFRTPRAGPPHDPPVDRRAPLALMDPREDAAGATAGPLRVPPLVAGAPGSDEL